jgi:hypothetical protein
VCSASKCGVLLQFYCFLKIKMYEVLFIFSKKIYIPNRKTTLCLCCSSLHEAYFIQFFNPGGHCTCVLCRPVIAANGQTAVSCVFCTRSGSLPNASVGKNVKFCIILRVCHRHSLQIIAPIKAVLQSRTALFWVITQRVLVISYRLSGTTYRSHLQESRIQLVDY